MRNQAELKIRVPQTLKDRYAEYATRKKTSVSKLLRNHMITTLKD